MNFSFNLNIFCLLHVCFVCTVISQNNLGPADIIVERVEQCENAEQYIVQNNLTTNKVNRTHIGFNGCFNITHDLDEHVSMNFSAAKWGDGGWKPNAIDLYEENGCQSLFKYVPNVWKQILEYLKAKEECPVLGEFYCVNNYVVLLENMFPSMLYGKFRVDVMFHLDGAPFLCIRVYVKSSPSKGSKFF